MNSTRRWILAGVGVLLVGIGALGVILPGLPTTIFLLGASWCFTRSCPWLEQRLMRNRFFAPYLRYLDGSQPMPMRARIVTIAMIWGAVSISLLMLEAQGILRTWGAITLVAAALVGTAVVWRFRREARFEKPSMGDASA